MVYTADMKLFLTLLTVSALVACANSGSVEKKREPDITQIAQELGCTSDQMPVCIEVNCEPEDYRCADRGDVRDLFGAGDHWRW